MPHLDTRLAREIEKVLLRPRPAFGSPAEFARHLATEIEPIIRAREEVAYRMGEASAQTREYTSA